MYSPSWPLKCVAARLPDGLSQSHSSRSGLFFPTIFNERSPPRPLGARLEAHSGFYLSVMAAINTHVRPVVSPGSKQTSLTRNASGCQSN